MSNKYNVLVDMEDAAYSQPATIESDGLEFQVRTNLLSIIHQHLHLHLQQQQQQQPPPIQAFSIPLNNAQVPSMESLFGLWNTMHSSLT
ncbi:hypothetical protein G6F42_026812 [Rhizopus arrhizus]|nr:hypothetical protein G6F42_026812 [Rhizopus arrhizus]